MSTENEAQTLMLAIIVQDLNESLKAIKNHHKSFKGTYREALKLAIEDFQQKALKIIEGE